jgi:hypothetical protein
MTDMNKALGVAVSKVAMAKGLAFGAAEAEA